MLHVAGVLAGPFPGFVQGEADENAGHMAFDMEYLARLGKDDRLGIWMTEAGQVT